SVLPANPCEFRFPSNYMGLSSGIEEVDFLPIESEDTTQAAFVVLKDDAQQVRFQDECLTAEDGIGIAFTILLRSPEMIVHLPEAASFCPFPQHPLQPGVGFNFRLRRIGIFLLGCLIIGAGGLGFDEEPVAR